MSSSIKRIVFVALLCGLPCSQSWCKKVEVKVNGLPRFMDQDPRNKAEAAVFQRFVELHPDIRLKSTTGLRIEGSDQDMVTLMQIAGDIAPDILGVGFRSSDTYIRKGFLQPLDDYVAKLDRRDLARRVPPAVRDVCYREGPDGKKHWYLLPTARMVRVLVYRFDHFAKAGINPNCPPRTWSEFEDYCKKLSRPDQGRFGMVFSKGASTAYDFANLVWSRGGDIVAKNKQGDWEPRFNTPEMVDALYFYVRLNAIRWRGRDGKIYRGVATRDPAPGLYRPGHPYAMTFLMLGDRLNELQFDNSLGFGPVPHPDKFGKSSAEINCSLLGIFSKVRSPEVVKAAFEYMAFLDSDEANRIRTKVYVQTGYGRYANPELLEKYGYKSYLRGINTDWVKVYRKALMDGKPEPYGKNCQVVYRELSKPIEQALNDKVVLAALDRGDEQGVKRRLKVILNGAQAETAQRMFGILPPAVERARKILTLAFLCLVSLGFGVACSYLMRSFRQNAPSQVPGHKKSLMAYFLLFPAVGTVILWQYYPLVRGTIIAFQDYSVVGVSPFCGVQNFSEVLFDPSFWHSMYVTVLYTGLYMMFGFLSPIVLALLLSEVPSGKMLYRTIFYLPAVLSGLVVTFLWKSFYGPAGMLNTLLGHIGVNMTSSWLDSPTLAMVAVLLPVVWAGMGPGCLIYLAAFKTIPDEFYEAAEVDGAGMRRKIWNITLPSIRMLIRINAVGAFIGAFLSSEMIFAMTAGGPYTPYGTTEVVGLQLFYTAFAYLKFGVANAMAWVLGFMLIGFTMFQLKNLSNVEFKGGR
ncbi:MAG: extracellular solute-binding protein [Armatimonadetes bacterium]|nr:extracellular solute-binding protein [Armatimonadota bacterium]